MLRDLQKELFDLSARNPLVHITPDKLWFIHENANNASAQKMVQKARFYEKEYGLNTSLFVSHFIRWKNPASGNFCTSPLLCTPTRLTEKKRETITYQHTETDVPFFVNPVLRKIFSTAFQLHLPEEAENSNDLITLLCNEFNQLQRIDGFDENASWAILEAPAVGIFNYHKLGLARDYEQMLTQPSTAVFQLLGEPAAFLSNSIPPTFSELLDASQRKAVSLALNGPVVIQGPPGTGKSHTLVALIKCLMAANKKVLFVSEKRAALEVVYQRLKEDKLDGFTAYFNPESDEKKQFYAQLKKSWLSHSQTDATNAPAITLQPTSDLFNGYPKKLLEVDPKSHTSLQQLLEKLIRNGAELPREGLNGLVPDLAVWTENLPLLLHFEQYICSAFQVNQLSEMAFFGLQPAVFREPDPIEKLQKRLAQLTTSISKTESVIQRYSLDPEPSKFLRLSIASSILAMVNKNQLALLQKTHKKYKTFNTLAKKYQLTKNKLHQAELLNQKWSNKPSVSEITELNDLLRQKKVPGKKKNILGILKRNATRELDYFADFDPGISTVTKLQLLEELKLEWHLRGELEALRIKLQHDLSIAHPDTEIDHILQVRTKLEAVTENEYIFLLEHPASLELISTLAALHPTIHQQTSLLSYLFYKTDHTSLQNHLQLLTEEIPLISEHQVEITVFYKTPDRVLQFLATHPGKVDALDHQITWHALNQASRFEPVFKKLSGEHLLRDFVARKQGAFQQQQLAATRIAQETNAFLKSHEKRSETPASKLNVLEKTQKQKYREAKRTLIHEFSKKKQHLAVMELMQNYSDLVNGLLPLWMMNPLAVSHFLPCIENLFDYVIFDEASQIPLEDAMPAVHRGKNLVVVGDSQQMPPGQFFSANSEGKTLLDQAESVFPQVMLTNHYRSQHPDLIQFSNRHFYDFELTTLPAVTLEHPIVRIPVNGVFEDGKNVPEAQALARHYSHLLTQGKTDIGIIAFSKEQQQEIERQLKLLKLNENENLLLRNLENVQGIEKDIILISIGYARNQAGHFRKQFGPVNHERGANRLNVLFTRAKRQMVVFTSINAADFGLSDNRGVQILADFLRYAEGQKSTSATTNYLTPLHARLAAMIQKKKIPVTYVPAGNGISISSFVQPHSGKILLADPCLVADESRDLFPLLLALEKRFTEIKIITSKDLLDAPGEVEAALDRYFLHNP